MSWPELIPPWDQARYFQTPRETVYSALSSVTTVALSDPTRVALVFSASGDYGVAVSIRSTVSTGGGLMINPGDPPLVLTHSMLGPLVQQQWYAIGAGTGSNLTVSEVSLSQWPTTANQV